MQSRKDAGSGSESRLQTTSSGARPSDSAAGDPSGGGDWVLFVAHHPSVDLIGAKARLRQGGPVRLGRAGSPFEEADLLDYPEISRVHAVLEPGHDWVRVSDRSRHGTRVNGGRCTDARLADGDVLTVGPVLLLLRRTAWGHREPRHDTLVGRSFAMSRLLDAVARVAARGEAVLVRGETGTGKELVSREVHRLGGRIGAYVAINCGEMSEQTFRSELFGHVRGAFTGADAHHTGLAEVASGGTIFFDEIAKASLAVQAILLRFLEDKRVRPVGGHRDKVVDVRVLAAAKEDLQDLVDRGHFRIDLYHRLAVHEIEIPALRHRIEDVPHIVAHFLRRFDASDRAVSQGLMLTMLRYGWPGNVRELHNVLAVAVAEANATGSSKIRTTDAIRRKLGLDRRSTDEHRGQPETEAQLGPACSPTAHEAVPTRAAVHHALQASRGNVQAAAKALGLAKTKLYRLLERLRIDLASYR